MWGYILLTIIFGLSYLAYIIKTKVFDCKLAFLYWNLFFFTVQYVGRYHIIFTANLKHSYLNEKHIIYFLATRMDIIKIEIKEPPLRLEHTGILCGKNPYIGHL